MKQDQRSDNDVLVALAGIKQVIFIYIVVIIDPSVATVFFKTYVAIEGGG